jgi:hypothetical protein
VKVTDTEQMFVIAMTGTFETMAYGLRRTGYKYITAATSEPTNVTAKMSYLQVPAKVKLDLCL